MPPYENREKRVEKCIFAVYVYDVDSGGGGRCGDG